MSPERKETEEGHSVAIHIPIQLAIGPSILQTLSAKNIQLMLQQMSSSQCFIYEHLLYGSMIYDEPNPPFCQRLYQEAVHNDRDLTDCIQYRTRYAVPFDTPVNSVARCCSLSATLAATNRSFRSQPSASARVILPMK
jgi:hypothetical protein